MNGSKVGETDAGRRRDKGKGRGGVREVMEVRREREIEEEMTGGEER